VYLCSPETATASAIRGVITDPRELADRRFRVRDPDQPEILRDHLVPPADPQTAARVELEKGPNIEPLPDLSPLPDELELPVVIKLGDHVSTDEIMPAGSRVLPLRSNIPAISRFVFWRHDEGFHDRALEHRDSGSVIVAGRNYGQGSSREHAALAPRYLGVRVVLAQGFARIHQQNLTNFGILPLTFEEPEELDRIELGDVLRLEAPRTAVERGHTVEIVNLTRDRRFYARHDLTDRQREVVLAGSVLSVLRRRAAAGPQQP
jgi:aconitate hydratase